MSNAFTDTYTLRVRAHPLRRRQTERLITLTSFFLGVQKACSHTPSSSRRRQTDCERTVWMSPLYLIGSYPPSPCGRYAELVAVKR